MRHIKIFLASSITELKIDRIQISDFIRQLNTVYVDHGVYFDLVMCESYDQSVCLDGKQTQLDKELQNSELAFFVFLKKVGDYTRHEFEVAIQSFKSCNKPKIVTYFKYINSVDEVTEEIGEFMSLLNQEFKHYYHRYNHIDTLKLGMLMQIKLMGLDEYELMVDSGKIKYGDLSIGDANNIPIFSGSEKIAELKSRYAKLSDACAKMKSKLAEKYDDFLYSEYCEMLNNKKAVENDIKETENYVFSITECMVKKFSDGTALSEKQIEAYRLMEQGKWEEALNELDEQVIMAEVEHNTKLADKMVERIQINVNELVQRIEVLKGLDLTRAVISEINTLYENVFELIIKYNLKYSPIIDYLEFLHSQNDGETALKLIKKTDYLFADSNTDVTLEDKATMLRLSGAIFTHLKRYDESEQKLKQAVAIYEKLYESQDEDSAINIERAYNSIAILYFYRNNYLQYLFYIKKALEIAEKHIDSNDIISMAFYAQLCDNYGIAFEEVHDLNEENFSNALNYHLRAIDIYKSLLIKKSKYKIGLARCYHNVAWLYSQVNNPEKALYYYDISITIREEIMVDNPGAVEKFLAQTYNNKALMCLKLKMTDEAKGAYVKGYLIYKSLRMRSSAYAKELSWNLKGLISLLISQNKTDEASELLKEYFSFINSLDNHDEQELYCAGICLDTIVDSYSKMRNKDKAMNLCRVIFDVVVKWEYVSLLMLLFNIYANNLKDVEMAKACGNKLILIGNSSHLDSNLNFQMKDVKAYLTKNS